MSIIIHSQLNQWCQEAGGDIEIEFEHKFPKVTPTALNDTNPYWMAFQKTLVEEL